MPIDPTEVSALWRILGSTTIIGLIVGTRKIWLPYTSPVSRALWTFLQEHWHPHQTIEHQRSQLRQERLAFRREHAMREFAEHQFKIATEDIEELKRMVTPAESLNGLNAIDPTEPPMSRLPSSTQR